MNFKDRLCAMNCHYRFYSLESFFRDARDAGYAAAEVWCGPMHVAVDWARRDDSQALVDLAERYGIHIIGICPEQTNPKPANMAARGEGAQARTLATFKNVIDLARDAHAGKIVVTSGWGFLDEPREDAWKRSVAMLRVLHTMKALQAIKVIMPDDMCSRNHRSHLRFPLTS